MKAFSFQRIGEYKDSDQGSTQSARQYKDSTDLILQDGGGEDAMEQKTIVRRLTPLECTRLQGYPDGWVDIGEPDEKGDYYYTDPITGKRRKVTDSAKYKALGNSIALPFWRYLMRRIVAQYEHEVTMGSLFDGISGFCLVAKQCGCQPVWSSEIESFPIAVCKQHFGDEETGQKGDIGEFL